MATDWNAFKNRLKDCSARGLTIEQAAKEFGMEVTKFRQNYQSLLTKAKKRFEKIAKNRYEESMECSLEEYSEALIEASLAPLKLVGKKGRRADDIDFDIVEPDV